MFYIIFWIPFYGSINFNNQKHLKLIDFIKKK